MEPHYLTLAGAIMIAIGGIVAGTGSYLQYIQQADFEKQANLNFERTLDSVNETLKSITGGDSFCYISFQVGADWISDFAVVSQGKYPMYDVSLRLYDPDDFALSESISMEKFLEKDLLQLEVGNIAVSQAKSFPEIKKINMQGKKRKVLRAEIHARNGSFNEDFLIKKVGDRWLRALRVYKSFSEDIIFEWSEPDFPKNQEGKILWD